MTELVRAHLRKNELQRYLRKYPNWNQLVLH